jgi:hypothetical protein
MATDLTGQRFGRLVAEWPSGMVEQSAGKTRHGKPRIKKFVVWLCLCDCGNLKLLTYDILRKIKSCGCAFKEYVEKNSKRLAETVGTAKTHGHWVNGKASPEYVSWIAMKSRCYYEKDKEFRRYGGSGVIVCERWRNCFEDFLADMGPRPKGTTLDRWPNNYGNYEPGNVRWATASQQAQNRRTSKSIARSPR